jgi:hypothetical protein
MARIILAIDQQPSRSSYGLRTPLEARSYSTAEQKQTVISNIATVAAQGDRKARIGNNENAIIAIASEMYLSEPQKEVALQYIDRPAMQTREVTGIVVNIFA